jgi:hypothetical protein
MSIAKVENGVVVQVDRTTDEAPDGWVACGYGVACGMTYTNGVFAAPAADGTAAALREIARLEATITPRRLREAVLSAEGAAWLAAVDAAIAAERAKLN